MIMILLQRKCIFTIIKQTLCEVVENHVALLVASYPSYKAKCLCRWREGKQTICTHIVIQYVSVLSCQPGVTVTSCFIYKVIRDL